MFFLETQNKADCYGCRACELICPTKCIRMCEDDEGFLYPVREDSECIRCDICRTVCPKANKSSFLGTTDGFESRAFMAVHKDEEVLYKSASGGLFSAIVSSFCTENFAVFGVGFNEHFKAIHSYTETVLGTNIYRKSKYIQSDVNDSYEKVKKFLQKGKRVLFTGTPCQIAGLRLYLKQQYDNLLCVDLVCHGVPSQKVFDHYIDYLQDKHRGYLSSYEFRHKTNKSGTWNSRNVRAEVGNVVIVADALNDPYLRGFHNALFCRPSCYECKFANPSRVSDITMADFWGVESLYHEENVHKGVSVLLVNTPKGLLLMDELSKHMRIRQVDKTFIIENNSQLKNPTNRHPKRTEFFENLQTTRFDKLINRCVPKPLLIRRIASRVLSRKTKDFIKRLIE